MPESHGGKTVRSIKPKKQGVLDVLRRSRSEIDLDFPFQPRMVKILVQSSIELNGRAWNSGRGVLRIPANCSPVERGSVELKDKSIMHRAAHDGGETVEQSPAPFRLSSGLAVIEVQQPAESLRLTACPRAGLHDAAFATNGAPSHPQSLLVAFTHWILRFSSLQHGQQSWFVRLHRTSMTLTWGANPGNPS